MAQTKKTTKKAATKKAATKAEIIPDFHADFTTQGGAQLTLDLYDSGDAEKNDRVKITVGDAIVIYCTAVIYEKIAFLSWPSFKTRDGKFINHAFSFDKDLNEAIGEALTDYYFSD